MRNSTRRLFISIWCSIVRIALCAFETCALSCWASSRAAAARLRSYSARNAGDQSLKSFLSSCSYSFCARARFRAFANFWPSIHRCWSRAWIDSMRRASMSRSRCCLIWYFSNDVSALSASYQKTALPFFPFTSLSGSSVNISSQFASIAAAGRARARARRPLLSV